MKSLMTGLLLGVGLSGGAFEAAKAQERLTWVRCAVAAGQTLGDRGRLEGLYALGDGALFLYDPAARELTDNRCAYYPTATRCELTSEAFIFELRIPARRVSMRIEFPSGQAISSAEVADRPEQSGTVRSLCRVVADPRS